MSDSFEAPKARPRFSPVQKGVTLTVICLLAIGVWILCDRFEVKEAVGREHREIKAMSAALEEYRAANGTYPSDPFTTERLRTRATFDPERYIPSSQFLYKALSGDSDGRAGTTSPRDTRPYFEFKPHMLREASDGSGTYVVDPFGNSYGYSTYKARNPQSVDGYNVAFDLWTTRGGTTERQRKKWHGNW